MTEKTLEERLDQVFGDHMDAETAGDLEGTLATMAPNPHIVNIPTMIGGQGELKYFSWYLSVTSPSGLPDGGTGA